MKIKFNQDYNYSFDGINPTPFKEGHVYDLSDSFCSLMIERGYAVSAEPKEFIIENKKAHIEDKKVFTKAKADKVLVTEKVMPPVKAQRGRPPKKKGKRK